MNALDKYDDLDTAMAISLRAHNGQVNSHNGEPYILHVFRVARHVKARGLDETHQAVAWLHDTLEDTDFTYNDLLTVFSSNPTIIHSVMALTKVKGITNEAYYKNLRNYPVAARVKISDLTDNFSRNHLIAEDATRIRMGMKYSLGFDILKEFM